jgi:hypothetical protein
VDPDEPSLTLRVSVQGRDLATSALGRGDEAAVAMKEGRSGQIRLFPLSAAGVSTSISQAISQIL